MSQTEQLAYIIDACMDKIKSHLKPNMEVTVLVRDPKNDETVIIMSNDDLVECARVLKIYADRQGTKDPLELRKVQ